MKFGLGLAAALTLSACAGGIVPRVGPPTTTSIKPVTSSATSPRATAQLTGVVAGPQVATLPITPDQATRALTAFRLGCPGLLRRADKSGLTQADDWAPACAAAETATDTRGFFIDQFEAIQVGSGQSYATGYYEPEIQGSRTRDAANQVPVYAKPDDLVEIDLGTFTETLKGRLISGRVSGLKFVPYYDRGEIDDGAIAGQVPVIAWAADPIEFFFLQIQGSGRLKLADGSVMRIGYAGQNGRDYVSIARPGLGRAGTIVHAGNYGMAARESRARPCHHARKPEFCFFPRNHG
jgi:membrane-bound lytic murein transglycosylase A